MEAWAVHSLFQLIQERAILNLFFNILYNFTRRKKMSEEKKEGLGQKSSHSHDHTHHHHHGHGHHGHSHGEGGLSIDYYAYASRLRSLNPVFKVGFSVAVLILTICLNQPAVSLFVILSMGFLTIQRGGVDFFDYLSLMTIPIATSSAGWPI